MRYVHLIDMHIIIIIPCKQLRTLIFLPSLLLCHWREQISLLSFSTENVNTTPQVYCIVPPRIILHHQYVIAVVLTFFAVKITPSFCTSHNNFRSWSHWMFVSIKKASISSHGCCHLCRLYSAQYCMLLSLLPWPLGDDLDHHADMGATPNAAEDSGGQRIETCLWQVIRDKTRPHSNCYVSFDSTMSSAMSLPNWLQRKL